MPCMPCAHGAYALCLWGIVPKPCMPCAHGVPMPCMPFAFGAYALFPCSLCLACLVPMHCAYALHALCPWHGPMCLVPMRAPMPWAHAAYVIAHIVPVMCPHILPMICLCLAHIVPMMCLCVAHIVPITCLCLVRTACTHCAHGCPHHTLCPCHHAHIVLMPCTNGALMLPMPCTHGAHSLHTLCLSYARALHNHVLCPGLAPMPCTHCAHALHTMHK